MKDEFQGFIEKVMAHHAHKPFHDAMLPKDITQKQIIDLLSFLSPSLIILHGSHVSNIRYTPDGKTDLDIVCVSNKSDFYPLDRLYEEFYNRKGNIAVKIDLSIINRFEFISIFKGKNSLRESFKNGFSILYFEENHGTRRVN